jgi:hypothetical protein
LKNIVGLKFNRLTVVGLTINNNKKYCLCVCDCGKNKTILAASVYSGHTRSCGCLQKEKAARKKIDLIGNKFGRLTVIDRAITHNRQYKWICKCDCGKEVSVFSGSLTRGLTTSCGCYQKECATANATKHGYHKTRTYNSYLNILSRCYDKKSARYYRYGGRGITVCDRWLGNGGFINFLEDIGKAPKDRQIDRINNDGNYEPENCRWATKKEQANNKSTNVFLTYSGITRTISGWAEQIGIKASCLYARKRCGWDDKRIIEVPLATKYRHDPKTGKHNAAAK